MDWSTLALFVPACFALNLSPGPNNLMALTTGAAHGVRHACLAALGRLGAFVVMIALASAGLAVVLHTSETLFFAIKIVGGLYLLWIAWKLWSADVGAVAASEVGTAALGTLARREFLVAAGNPKAILIFTAFLPQFVDPARPVSEQFVALGAAFLLLEWVAVALYAIAGARLGRLLHDVRRRRTFNRASAGLIGSAGVGLLLSGRSD